MKKSRRVRINGEDWRYFIDNGASDDDDDNTFCRIILYAPGGGRYFWNVGERVTMAASGVKRAFAEGKFFKVR
jgi:hypothetical protein